MEKLQTRKEYMSGELNAQTHQAYYGQAVTPYLVSFVVRVIGEARIMASNDQHFNDIPLIHWDNMASAIGSIAGAKLGAMNETRSYSLSDCVCLAKEAARQFKEYKQAESGEK